MLCVNRQSVKRNVKRKENEERGREISPQTPFIEKGQRRKRKCLTPARARERNSETVVDPRFVPTCNAEVGYTITTDRKKVEHITFKNGKTYRLKSVIANRRKQAIQKKIRADKARKQMWLNTHVFSRDDPNSKAYNADCGDNGKFVEKLVADIDKPINSRIRRENRERAISSAAVYLAHALGYKHGSDGYNQVLSFVYTIARHGKGARTSLMKQFGLNYHAYVKRVERYVKILRMRPR